VNELIKLDIPAKAEYVVLGRLALAGILRDRGYTADAVADLKLALTEACSNCIRHAYDGNSGQVHLRFTVRDDRVVLEVRDDGSGFSEDGMGISIIRSVVDEFHLDRPAEGGTTLVLTKLRDA